MGIEKRNCTFRLGEDTQGMLVQIQKAFWPVCEDLSSTLRLVIRITHALLFMPVKVEEFLALPQLLHRKTSQYDALQLPLRFQESAR